MNILKKTFLGLAIAINLFLPQLVFAQSGGNASCDELKSHFPSNGNLTQDVNALPSYCNVEDIYKKIMNIALYAIGIVAVIMIIYGGYIYMTAGGNADQAKRGRTILMWAIAGLIVVLAAASIVNIVVKYVVEN